MNCLMKLSATEIDRLRAIGYDLPHRHYWMSRGRILTSKTLLSQLGYQWGDARENALHELDIIIQEDKLDWTGAIIIKELLPC